jgi:acyl carrier protein
MTTPTPQSDSDIARHVLEMFSTELNIAVGPDAAIAELSSIDSVKLMRLVTRIEDRHGITLDDDRVFNVVTVGDLIDVITDTVAATG